MRAGKLRALGVTTAQRWASPPEVPAIAETVPGFEINVWYGIFAPRTTPPEIVATFNAAVSSALDDPKIVARFAEDGGIPLTLPRSELAKFLADDLAKWRKIVELAGITPE